MSAAGPAGAGGRLRRWLPRLAGPLFAALLLVLAEGASRLLLPVTPLQEILAVLQRDAWLLWRQRPHLDTTFQGAAVRTDGRGMRVGAPAPGPAPRAAGGARPLTVVCLGASPTFGYGVRHEQTYAHLLQERLRATLRRPVRVIDAAMIGHSTFQGLRLLRAEILPLRPDLITIPYVLNDVDSYRFFYSDGRPDKRARPLGPRLTAVRNLLDRSRLFHALERLVQLLAGRRASLGDSALQVHPPGSVRVSPGDYRANLTAMVALARAQRIPVVLLKMPVNLPPSAPVPAAARAQGRALLAQARARVEQGDCDGAGPLLRRALGQDPSLGGAHHYLGRCALRQGDEAAAQAHLARAMAAEAGRCGRRRRRHHRHRQQVAQGQPGPQGVVVQCLAQFIRAVVTQHWQKEGALHIGGRATRSDQ